MIYICCQCYPIHICIIITYPTVGNDVMRLIK